MEDSGKQFKMAAGEMEKENLVQEEKEVNAHLGTGQAVSYSIRGTVSSG